MELIKFALTSSLDLNNTQNLYCRLSSKATIQENTIIIPKDEYITLDTYYNLISSKYFHYINLINPNITFNYLGNIFVELHLKSNKDDIILFQDNYQSKTRNISTIYIDSSTIISESFLYLKIKSLDNSEFYGGSFNCDNSPRDINIGISMCTFKRESFVKDNMQRFNQYFSINTKYANNITPFIIDNGQTLSINDLPKNCILIPNENTGGSGGFTKGLKEILSKEIFTHCLFMDDDVAFEPFIVERTLALLSVLKEEYKDFNIGGTMLIKDTPTIQHEFGGCWNGNSFKPNREKVDLTLVNELLLNEKYYKTSYNAWWYSCMSLNTINKIGLPLDFLFVQYDDVEYGLRSNTEFININGIGLWHENFNYKFNPAYEYFIKRNNMIVMCRFPHHDGIFSCWIKYVKAISKALVTQRYFMFDIIDLAYNDFLKGADYIKSLNQTDMLLKAKSLCVQQSNSNNFADKYHINLDEELNKTLAKKGNKLKEALTLNSYFLPRSTYDNIRVVPQAKCACKDFYKANICIQYNPYTNQAFETQINKKMLFKGFGKCFKMFFKILGNFYKVKKSYKNL